MTRRDEILFEISNNCGNFNKNLMSIEKSLNVKITKKKRKEILTRIIKFLLTENLFMNKPTKENIEYFIYNNYKFHLK
jgi:hypothetical protein